MKVLIFLTVILTFSAFFQTGCKGKSKAAGTANVSESSLKRTDKSYGKTTTGDSLAESPAANSNKITKTFELPAKEIARQALPAVVLITGDYGDETVEGSGFFVLPGVVVTNFHVIEDIDDGTLQITFESRGGKRTVGSAQIISCDAAADLALIDVPAARETPVVTLSLVPEDTPVEVGETVYALGNPEGLVGTFSQGIVSAELKSFDKSARVQVSAPISEGSSGGPLLNSKGEVVGVIVSSMAEGQNLNFAVPHFLVHSIIKSATIQQYNREARK